MRPRGEEGKARASGVGRGVRVGKLDFENSVLVESAWATLNIMFIVNIYRFCNKRSKISVTV